MWSWKYGKFEILTKTNSQNASVMCPRSICTWSELDLNYFYPWEKFKNIPLNFRPFAQFIFICIFDSRTKWKNSSICISNTNDYIIYFIILKKNKMKLVCSRKSSYLFFAVSIHFQRCLKFDLNWQCINENPDGFIQSENWVIRGSVWYRRLFPKSLIESPEIRLRRIKQKSKPKISVIKTLTISDWTNIIQKNQRSISE